MTSDSILPHISSFEETFKMAYSHGLEQIYALEKVDLSKVTRIEVPSCKTIPELDLVEPGFSLWNGQYQIELGDEYRGWMSPLFLQEPVQILKLSQRIEKELLEKEKYRLSDLFKKDALEKIGQRDIFEIESKLEGYCISRSQERTFFIEWASLIRSLFVGSDWKKGTTLLERYDLEGLIFLNALDKMEFLSLRTEKREQWIQEMKDLLGQSKKQEQISALLNQIAKVFVTPWMWKRGGIATLEEIEERVENVSEQPSITKKAISFLSTFFSQDTFLFKKSFCEVEEGLFVADRFYQEAFHEVCSQAETYFYHPDVFYPLEELLRLLCRDFASEWKSYPEEWMKAYLRRSSRFYVSKGEGKRGLGSGELEIRLN